VTSGLVTWICLSPLIFKLTDPIELILWIDIIPISHIFFLINLFWLIPVFERKNKNTILYVFEQLALTILLIVPFFIINKLFINYYTGVKIGINGFYIVLYLFMLIVSLSLSWLVYTQKKKKKLQVAHLKKELGKTTSDLQFLRSQINPHFLFNSLNTLYGISMQENAAKTGDGIQKLGDMMRFMLHDNQQDLIPLSKELSYLKDYIYLQQLRLEENESISLEINITECPDAHYIAPMLLIPFVENTFKHGISLQEKSWVKIDLRCDETKLFFETANSAHPKTIHDPEKNKSGIGLDNVKQRLQLLYPGKYDLMIRETPQEFFVHLSLTLS
jgi:sensor histidine kinase YesM